MKFRRLIAWLSRRSYKLGLLLETRSEEKWPLSPHTDATSVYLQVEAECNLDIDSHAQYWWSTSGHALAVLLDRAGYTTAGQYESLKFFRAITPILGPAFVRGEMCWKSFMTDDHNPVELSWDWRLAGQSPKVRFSIEPIGREAGTHLDSLNESASSELQKIMVQMLPQARLEVLSYFQQQLRVYKRELLDYDHLTQEFYAFDLDEGGIMGKAYFFPQNQARATGKDSFDVILNVLKVAPLSAPDDIHALRVFQEYVDDVASPALEMDMLAIDLVEPEKSRFKIYFRIRDTRFSSIQETMTLRGRITTPGITEGLKHLRILYHALQENDDCHNTPDTAIHMNDHHRTAGILYYVEFRYGAKQPKVKAYLPVRHFAQSEEAIIAAIHKQLGRYGDEDWVSNSMANYTDAVRTLW